MQLVELQTQHQGETACRATIIQAYTSTVQNTWAIREGLCSRRHLESVRKVALSVPVRPLETWEEVELHRPKAFAKCYAAMGAYAILRRIDMDNG